MIKNYAQTTIKLQTLLDDENCKNAIDTALQKYPLYKPHNIYDLIPEREEINEKLLNHYKYYEIGFETIGRFIDELKITMCEIMPYYNEMFKTVEIMADLENPFDNVDVTETFEQTTDETNSSLSETTGSQTGRNESSATSNVESTGENTHESTNTQTNTNEKTRKFSDTPQNNISSINNYLTDYTVENEKLNQTNSVESSDNSTSTTNGADTSSSSVESSDTRSSNNVGERKTTTKHTYNKKGNQGVNTYAHDMNEFRTSIIDVVEKIINDKRVADLFMSIY